MVRRSKITGRSSASRPDEPGEVLWVPPGPSAAETVAELLAGKPAALERRVAWRQVRATQRELAEARWYVGGHVALLLASAWVTLVLVALVGPVLSWRWLLSLDAETRLFLGAVPTLGVSVLGWLLVQRGQAERRYREAEAAWCRVAES